MSDVHDDQARSRYELRAGEETAIAVYQRRGDTLVFTHTEVPRALEGQGIGRALVAGALADVRARQLKVRPNCLFVAAYIDRHPAERDLLA